AAGSQAGWRVALQLLDLYLGGREGSQLSARAVLGTSGADLAELWPYLGAPDERASWLGPSGGDPAVAGAAHWFTLGQHRRTALVLAHEPPFEHVSMLPDMDVVLRMRLITLTSGSTLVCLQLLSWAGEAILENLVPPLATALDELLARFAPARVD